MPYIILGQHLLRRSTKLAERETDGCFTGGLHESRKRSALKAFEKSNLTFLTLTATKYIEKKIRGKESLAMSCFKKNACIF